MPQTTSRQNTRQGKRQNFQYLVTLLCVLLILFVGVAQVLHSHTPDEATNANCSLCAVAHVSVLATPVQATPVIAEVVLPVAPPDPVAPPRRSLSFNLYVRPPPVATALS
jgi:hypothetical protein